MLFTMAAGGSGNCTDKELELQRPVCPKAGLASKKPSKTHLKRRRFGGMDFKVYCLLGVCSEKNSERQKLGALVPSASRVTVWTE